jgi:hypothetical protein
MYRRGCWCRFVWEFGRRMKLPPDVQFHEDARLFIWRPRGVLDDAALPGTADPYTPPKSRQLSKENAK